MQTPAEIHLIHKLAEHMSGGAEKPVEYRILNIGAGKSVSIEERLRQIGCRFLCDRTDLGDCAVDFPAVRNCWKCPIDDMKPAPSAHYDGAFANYVLEHVENLRGAIKEINRILAPGGVFVASLPNPSAPEFVVSKYTPLWFHRWVRGGHGWETAYAYRNVAGLLELFAESGFEVKEEEYWSCVQQYVSQYRVLDMLGRIYDRVTTRWNVKRLMGNACIVVKKTW